MRSAVDVLIASGHLAVDDRSVWLPELPAAQLHHRVDMVTPRQSTDQRDQLPAPRTTSTERVRQFRQRQRDQAAAVVSAHVPETVSLDVSFPVSGVSGGVSSGVSPSRGDSYPESSETSEIQRNQEKIDHPDQSSRARGVVSARPRDVSSEIVSTRWTDDEVSKISRSPEQALRFPVHERAVFLRAHPRLADALQPTAAGLGVPGWFPTLELTVYVRAVPTDGFLVGRHRTQELVDGWFDEDCELWDSRGRLVCQARQLAGYRLPSA